MLILLASAALIATGEPRSVDLTSRSVEEVTGCVVSTLADTRGYEIQKTATPTGNVVALKHRIMGIARTAARIEIVDAGAERRLIVFAGGKATGGPRVFAERTRVCASK